LFTSRAGGLRHDCRREIQLRLVENISLRKAIGFAPAVERIRGDGLDFIPRAAE
jgi:hypothetical protein